MKPARLHALLVLMLLALSASWCLAQNSDSDSKGKATDRSITGCLTQGDNAKEFLLTGQDGSTWEVRSDSVSLADHVGHMVKATGVVRNSTMHNMKEDAKDAAHDSGMKKDNNEHGHMDITDVQMVSDSCK